MDIQSATQNACTMMHVTKVMHITHYRTVAVLVLVMVVVKAAAATAVGH
jgi:hypothetical protein